MAKKPPVALVQPSSIGSEEAAYLTTLVAQKQQADATLNAFTSYLAQKYQLGEGDGLKPDGTIQRKVPA